jgi:hypothetical protein
VVERLTEKVKMKLVDGTEQEVLLYKFLGARVALKIQNKLLAGTKINPKSVDSIELDGGIIGDLTLDIAQAIWADKNITIDDVNGSSLQEVVFERLDYFLGGFNLQREK